jgi:hypothetical protein
MAKGEVSAIWAQKESGFSDPTLPMALVMVLSAAPYKKQVLEHW